MDKISFQNEMDRFFRFETHAESKRARIPLKSVFLQELNLLDLGPATLGMPEKATGMFCVALDSPTSEITEQKVFCLFLGKTQKQASPNNHTDQQKGYFQREKKKNNKVMYEKNA